MGHTTRLAIEITADDKGSATIRRLGETAEQAGRKTSTSMRRASRSMATFNQHLGAAYHRVVSLQGALVGLGVGYIVHRAVDDFRKFDLGLRSVKKTTSLAGEELDVFGERVQRMSLDMPTSAPKLLEIAEAAGQLGVDGADNLETFTRTIAQLEFATDMAGRDAAMQFARLLKVSGEAADEVRILGSVIVSLGNNMAATESEITRMATEIGQATAAFDVSSASSAAMGAALRSMGVRAELGGSAVGRAFRAMDATIRGGGEAFRYLQQITDRTGEDLRRTFERDATRAFQVFIQGLGRAMDEGESAAEVLDRFGLSGEEILKVLPTVAKRADELGRALNIANAETKDATALLQEAAERQRTFDAQLDRGANALSLMATTLGEELAGPLGDTVDEFVEWTRQNDEFLRQDVASKIGEIGSAVQGLGKDLAGLAGQFADLPDPLQKGLLWGAGTGLVTRSPAAAAWAATGAFVKGSWDSVGQASSFTADEEGAFLGGMEDVLRRENKRRLRQLDSLGVDWTRGGQGYRAWMTPAPPIYPEGPERLDVQAPMLPGYNPGNAPADDGGGGRPNEESLTSFPYPADAAAAAEERVRIEQDLTDRIKELELDRFEHQRWLLDQELADTRRREGYLQADADTRQAIEEQLAQYKALKLEEIAAAEDAHLAEQARKRAEAAEQALRQSDKLWAGFVSGLEQSLPEAESGFERMERLGEAAFASIGQSSSRLMGDVVRGDIQSMEQAAVRMLSSLVDAVAQAQAAIWGDALQTGLKAGVSSLFGGSGGAESGAGSLPEVPEVDFSMPSGFAQGAAFAASGLEGRRNTVVTEPTLFRFAKGGAPSVGLMGEEPGAPGEAVMPLTRLPDGDLGVRARLDRQPRETGDVTINVQVVNKSGEDVQAQASARRNRRGEIDVVVELERSMARRVGAGQGELGKALESTYGLRRPGRPV